MLNKIIPIMIATITACGTPAQVSSITDSGAHYTARHCEIFIDRLSPVNGSHAHRSITIFVKTINARLDGPVAEVGFRNTWNRSDADGQGWHNRTLLPFVNADDYFVTTVTVSGDYIGRQINTGAFYVRTTKGTTYWANETAGGNYVFDFGLFTSIENRIGYGNYRGRPEVAVTTRDPGFQKFNPGECN